MMRIKWDRMEEHIQKQIEKLKNMLNSDVKFVGIRLFYLTEDDMLIQEGMFEKGFDPSEYE